MISAGALSYEVISNLRARNKLAISNSQVTTEQIGRDSIDYSDREVSVRLSGNAFGALPEYHLHIHGNGRVVYRGLRNTQFSGMRIGTVEDRQTAALFAYIEDELFWAMDDFYTSGETDQSKAHILIKIGDSEKLIVDDGNAGPYELRVLQDMAIDVMQYVQWE